MDRTGQRTWSRGHHLRPPAGGVRQRCSSAGPGHDPAAPRCGPGDHEPHRHASASWCGGCHPYCGCEQRRGRARDGCAGRLDPHSSRRRLPSQTAGTRAAACGPVRAGRSRGADSCPVGRGRRDASTQRCRTRPREQDRRQAGGGRNDARIGPRDGHRRRRACRSPGDGWPDGRGGRRGIGRTRSSRTDASRRPSVHTVPSSASWRPASDRPAAHSRGATASSAPCRSPRSSLRHQHAVAL